MSDIYNYEPVADFTDPFLDFDQGYSRPIATTQRSKATLVPIQPEEEELVLPEKPLSRKEQKTRRGYPQGESQGDSSGRIPLLSVLRRMLRSLSGSRFGIGFVKRVGKRFPTAEEKEERDKQLFVYRYNQGAEKTRRDNYGKSYPPLTQVRGRFSTSKYWHDGFRDIGLGDAVMGAKERWRKNVNQLDLDTFPKAWLGRGLREIHHENDSMDGRMDACLGFAAVMGCEIYDSLAEMREDMREEQKKRALDGWERMNVKRSLEDSLRWCPFLLHSLYEVLTGFQGWST